MRNDPRGCMCGALDCTDCGDADYKEIDQVAMHREVERRIANEFMGGSDEHEQYIGELFFSLPTPSKFRAYFFGSKTMFQALMHAMEARDHGKAMTLLHMLHGEIINKLDEQIQPEVIKEMSE